MNTIAGVWLQSLKILNYKSFFDEDQKVEFALPNGNPGSGMTVIVGPNNAGKSALLSVFKLLSNSDNSAIDKNERHDPAKVRFELAYSNNHQSILENEQISTLRFQKDAQGTKEPLASDALYFLHSRRHWSEAASPNSQNQTDQHTQRNLEKSRNSLTADDSFVNHLQYIEKEKKEEFTALIKRIIPSFDNWFVDHVSSRPTFTYAYNDGKTHVCRLGDGFYSICKIISPLLLQGNDVKIVIDEPELSLHPQAQKSLAKILGEYSANKQIIIATHSTYFINWDYIENGSRIVRLYLDANNHTIIGEPASATMNSVASLPNFKKIYLLDEVAKEFFFVDKNILFVEGLEDVSLIQKYLTNNNIDVNFEFFGYGIGGSGNVKRFLQLAKELGFRASVIFDKPMENVPTQSITLQDIENIKVAFPDYRAGVITLTTEDIRVKNEYTQQAKQGIFSENGDILDNYKSDLNTVLQNIKSYFQS